MAEPIPAIPVSRRQDGPRLSAVPATQPGPPEEHIEDSPSATVRVQSTAGNGQGSVLDNLGLTLSRISQRVIDFADREPLQFVLAIAIASVTAGAALRLCRSRYE